MLCLCPCFLASRSYAVSTTSHNCCARSSVSKSSRCKVLVPDTVSSLGSRSHVYTALRKCSRCFSYATVHAATGADSRTCSYSGFRKRFWRFLTSLCERPVSIPMSTADNRVPFGVSSRLIICKSLLKRLANLPLSRSLSAFVRLRSLNNFWSSFFANSFSVCSLFLPSLSVA